MRIPGIRFKGMAKTAILVLIKGQSIKHLKSLLYSRFQSGIATGQNPVVWPADK